MREIFVRRSIRNFDLTKKVSKNDLLKLVKAGFQAPSARNQQPWNFVIIDDEEIIKELATISKGSSILNNCNTVIAVLGDDPNKVALPNMMGLDLSAATQNIMLMATSMNLGSCWVGIYPLEDRMQSVQKILNINNNLMPFSLIAIGYPINDYDLKEVNRYKEEKVFFNRG